ncbi:MAG: nuclear transport factor 2 family protein [Actinobacteria bacterium]|nr:nuclear transport factor 2 family protein [Actinomycetota bacterium]
MNTEAHAELARLAAEYAAAVDGRDAEAFVALFAADATLTVPGPEPWILTGRDELRAIIDGVAGFVATLHFVGQSTYRIDGDDATGEVACLAHHLSMRGAQAVDQVWVIRYHDAYRHTDEGWRFARRDIELLWTEDHPAELPPT